SGRPTVATTIRAGEEVIFAAQRHGSDRPFDGVVVEIDAAVVQEAAKGWPAGEGVADRLGKAATARDATKLFLEPWLHYRDQRSGPGIAYGLPLVSGAAPDGLLDCIEFADAAQGFGGDRRPRRFVQVVEPSPCVCPTRGECDVAAVGEP